MESRFEDFLGSGDVLPMEPKLPELSLREYRNENRIEPPQKDLRLPKQKDIVAALSEFWRESEHCDFLVRIGEYRFPCHRLVLMAYIQKVRENPDVLDLELPEDLVSPGIFVSLYRWMTDHDILIKRSEIIQLLSVATYLKIDELLHQIWTCLESDEFSEHHAYQVAAEVLCFKTLKHLHCPMLQRIQGYFLTFVSCKEFLELSLESLCFILSSNEIAVNSETEVFYAAIRWLNHNWPERLKHVAEVLEKVRLLRVPKKLVKLLESPRGEYQVDRVTQLAEVRKSLEEISFAQILMQHSDGTSLFGEIYEIFQVTVPQARKFICHDLSPYHHPDPNLPGRVFSYSEFLKYLALLQTLPPDTLPQLLRRT
ncbi:uncharacterized protein Dana_GF13524 [Drosophila ananassae]|uniref:BTB domain-containing protein n=1 Tax=Drosophila ananassae TaxID=7217 RepID=B3MEG7_DROAN|nr:actin-binding protein IPP [Drosophila ananassae]EDV37587.1 uncharacterized protein Dana_GF13524 [Drosophila ananassae]